MFAALLLAVSPSMLPLVATPAVVPPVPGAPCVCFPVHHAGPRALPEEPLAKSAWTPARLADETLRVVRASDDLFVRAETLRTALRALDQRTEKVAEDVDASRAALRTLREQLALDLKRETELAPYSRAHVAVDRDLEATRARLAALPGVARVEKSPSEAALDVWFDAGGLTPERLRAEAAAGAVPSVQPPTPAPRARAAITLAFAGESSAQLGHAIDFDARGLAREAASLAPADPRVLILAAMVWFDDKAPTSASYVREALRHADGDDYARKNILAIFGVFFGADSLDELQAKVDRRIQRG